MLDKIQTLTPDILRIVHEKGTEPAYSGKYDRPSDVGTYICRRCGLGLFLSKHQFFSGCGWPSFDDELPNALDTKPDMDGRRTEILCHRCHAHLGHVFLAEGLTFKNLRHCVNSRAIEWIGARGITDTEEGIYGGGCFWGVEYAMQQLPGVLHTEVGYMGGDVAYPTYEQVCLGKTGHIETVRVLYHPEKIDYKNLTQYFFEIHNPFQLNRQGVDSGESYSSVIFYLNDAQKYTAQWLKEKLHTKHTIPATRIRAATTFWSAEAEHQSYYHKAGRPPTCYDRVTRF